MDDVAGSPDGVLSLFDEDRRTFLRKLILGSPFVKPAIASFTMASLAISEANVAVANVRLTSTSITDAAPNPANIGSPVTFQATVTPTGGGGSCSGTVTFLENASVVGGAGNPAALSGGVATFTTSSLGLGDHSITASYASGDCSPSSSSPPIVERILAAVVPALGPWGASLLTALLAAAGFRSVYRRRRNAPRDDTEA